MPIDALDGTVLGINSGSLFQLCAQFYNAVGTKLLNGDNVSTISVPCAIKPTP